MDIAAQKQALRVAMRAAMAGLPPARRALEEEAVQAAIQAQPAWRAAKTVLLYHAKAPEFSVVGLTLAAWRDGKRTLFPKVQGPRLLELREARSWGDFKPGAFGLREVADGPAIDPAAADLAIVPGLAFDSEGRRLGQGGGFYDALLPGLAVSWGVGFDCQAVSAVPWEPHDATVTDVWICREKGILDT